jgi:hypothetical protein
VGLIEMPPQTKLLHGSVRMGTNLGCIDVALFPHHRQIRPHARYTGHPRPCRRGERSALPQSDLIKSAQILLTLDFAAFWSDLLFATADDFSLFFYELLRNEAVLDKLGELTNASETNETPHGRLGPSGRAAESARNLRAIVAHFSSRLDEFKEASSADREPEMEDVLHVVNHSSEKLDLVESAELEHLRCERWLRCATPWLTCRQTVQGKRASSGLRATVQVRG